MKVFYVFNIRKEFKSIYKNNPSVLYTILKQIYYLNKEDCNYAFVLYNQIIKPINKTKLDNYLYIKFHQDIPYSKKGDYHIMNNLYCNERSKLIVKNSYIKIETEKTKNLFLVELKELNDFFICDFENSNFFFLENINTCNNY